jgi:hypothetical protein
MVEELEFTKCPNCKTRTLHREGDELVCSECKGRFAAPQGHSPGDKKTKREYILERHQFYEQNKDQLIRDYQAKGGKETAKKWKIAWTLLYQVLRRWGIIKKRIDADAAVPKHKITRSSQQSASRHVYYESHKQEIVSDLFAFGRTPTRKKWNISCSTLFTLERRWLTADEKAKLDNITFAPSPNGRLPQFPEFSSSWEPQVQVRWLEIYGKLLERNGKESER